jgi:hypothetical protein
MSLFAPPPFKPAESLLQLKRSLRDMRPLVERGDGFDLQGQRVIELRCDDSFIAVRIARKALRSPEWDTLVIKNGADLRKCVDEAKKRLVQWTEE